MLVLDDVEAVEERRLLRRVDLELLQLALTRAGVEAPHLQGYLHYAPPFCCIDFAASPVASKVSASVGTDTSTFFP